MINHATNNISIMAQYEGEELSDLRHAYLSQYHGAYFTESCTMVGVGPSAGRAACAHAPCLVPLPTPHRPLDGCCKLCVHTIGTKRPLRRAVARCDAPPLRPAHEAPPRTAP